MLNEAHIQEYIKFSVGAFSAVAVGFGVAFLLFTNLISGPGSLVGGFGAGGMLISIILTPLLAGVIGIMIGLEMNDDRKAATLTSSVGTFAGYLAFLVIAFVFSALISGGGSGGGGSALGDALGPALGFGIGVAVAGAVSTFATEALLPAPLTR